MAFDFKAQETLRRPTYITTKNAPELYAPFAKSEQVEVVNSFPIKKAEENGRQFLYIINPTRSEPLAVLVYSDLGEEHVRLLALHTKVHNEGYLLILFLYIVWILKMDVFDSNVITASGLKLYDQLIATDALCKYRCDQSTGESVSEVPSWRQGLLPDIWATVIGKGIGLEKLSGKTSFKGYP